MYSGLHCVTFPCLALKMQKKPGHCSYIVYFIYELQGLYQLLNSKKNFFTHFVSIQHNSAT